jgi:7,8-dihydropterin-6-yl-methyl-4-(beta-D-ribofuranosyl)aminobenzene 5'-phosphate synthase
MVSGKRLCSVMKGKWRRGIFWIVFGLLFQSMLLTGCKSTFTQREILLIKVTPSYTIPVPSPIPTDTQPPPAPSLQPSGTATEASQISTPGGSPSVNLSGSGDQMLQITIVYDNYPYQAGLKSAWGFSAYITYNNENILFDTGGSGTYLLSNLNSLDISPSGIQNVVLSHEHNDHTAGLQALLQAGADPKLYIPPSFTPGFKSLYQDQTRMIEVEPKLEITSWAYSLGEIFGPPPEQALVIDTREGLVIITGCAHPGVDKLIVEAKKQYQKGIYLVLGGFHLGSASDLRINQVINKFQQSEVRYVAPCHCTGDHAIEMIRDALGDKFIPVGVGAVISIES